MTRYGHTIVVRLLPGWVGAWLVGAFLWFCPAALASEFWDGVRTPGLARHRADLEEALGALGSGDAGRALTLAEAVLTRAPTSPDVAPQAHVLAGRALGALDRAPDAIPHFEQALALDPSAFDLPPHGPLAADISLRAGRFELAETMLRRMLGNMAPSDARRRLYVRYGDALMAQGPDRLHDALLAYREGGRDAASGNVEARIGLGLALLRAGEPARAMETTLPLHTYPLAERVIPTLPLPRQERAARTALLLETFGEHRSAREAWQVAASAPGPWRDQAAEMLARMEAGREPKLTTKRPANRR